MRVYLSAICIFIYFYEISFCQIEAITTSGEKVVLNEDGTWKYFKNNDAINISESKDSYDFRNVNWGDSISEVENRESAQKSDPFSVIIKMLKGLSYMTSIIFYLLQRMN